MKISVIINTCAFGKQASKVLGSVHDKLDENAVGTPHSARCYALANFIIPAYVHDENIHEVIVVGEWVEGRGYTYINVPSVEFDATDALAQRQAGFEASTGDVLIFQHDDHMLHPRATEMLMAQGMMADIMVPNRRKRFMEDDAPLNNGRYEGYIGGHCAVYKRKVLEKVPWSDIEKVFEWDADQTLKVIEEGFTITWPLFPSVYDIEV